MLASAGAHGQARGAIDEPARDLLGADAIASNVGCSKVLGVFVSSGDVALGFVVAVMACSLLGLGRFDSRLKLH